MAEFSQLLFESGFCTGAVFYSDHYEADKNQNRIVLMGSIEDDIVINLILDTASPWNVINPEFFEEKEFANCEKHKLNIRGRSYDGFLIRKNITIRATEGEDVTIESTFFIPRLNEGDSWNYPNFLGLDGFLNRIRCAINPIENTFYFGII